MATAARVRGGPGIPGSSLKGVLRSRYEAITRSCAGRRPPQRAKVQSSTGIKTARLVDSARKHDVFESCHPNRLCPACALFGRMSLRGRLTVTDFVATGASRFETIAIPERFGPNLHHIGTSRVGQDRSGNREFEVQSLHGRKFHIGRGPASDTTQRIEVVRKGQALSGEIRVFNLTRAELGGLLTAVGAMPPSALKVGGGKSHGLGRLQCKGLTCYLADAGGKTVAVAAEAWRSEFEQSPDRWEDGENQLVAWHRGDC